MKRFTGVKCGLLLLLLAGCASVQMAPPDQDIKAKDFAAPQNLALLYIYRSESLAPVVSMGVSVNGTWLGQTVVRSYFRLDVMPGTYRIESYARDVSTLDVTAEAGKTYFIWQEVKAGPVTQLQLVDDSVGRDGVTKSKLIVTSVVGETITPLAAGAPAQSAAQFKCAAPTQNPHTGESFPAAPPDKAVVYLYRPARFEAAINTFRINSNGGPITDLNNGNYYMCVVEPGMLQFVATTLHRPLMGPLMVTMLQPSQLALDAKKGETYFIDVQIVFSGGPQPRFGERERGQNWNQGN